MPLRTPRPTPKSQAQQIRHRAPARYLWSSARGFWTGATGRLAWLLTIGLIVLVFLQLYVQYRLNVWNRLIFDALERKDGGEVLMQATIFLALVMAAIALAVFSVYGRMTTQREWRAWLTAHLIDRWLAKGRYYQLNLIAGDHQNAEARIAEDARIATDPPVDFAYGILSAAITAMTFIGVLWVVGGDLAIGGPAGRLVVPGYLVIAALLYAALANSAMLLIGRRFVAVAENKDQAEAEFRYALTRLRENGPSIALLGGEGEERTGLRQGLAAVIAHWSQLCRQHMRTALVSSGNLLIAPVVPLFLGAPKYLAGTMTLGELMQIAAAFVQAQAAFNWIVDNYPRYADWMASVRRVAALQMAIDQLDRVVENGKVWAIERREEQGPALRLRGLSVMHDDGTVVVNDADMKIEAGERVLVVGESGTGKNSLIRAIAGLWPWGRGEVITRPGAKLFLISQFPYVPLGSLRRIVTYPLPADQITAAAVQEVMELVGLAPFNPRLDEEAPWDELLSDSEKQRVAFARLLLHRPDIVILDHGGSPLDTATLKRLMTLVVERLPNAAIVSIANVRDLADFHQRELVLEHQPGGTRLVGHIEPAPPAGFLPRLLNRWRQRRSTSP